MNKIKIYLYLLLTASLVYTIHSQELKRFNNKPTKPLFTPQRNVKPGLTAITVSKDDRSKDMIPSDDSERFKIKFKIEEDSTQFILNAEKYEYGKHINDIFHNERIRHISELVKGENIFFELVPDTSKKDKLTLFTYFPNQTSFRYMNYYDKECIKYRVFKECKNNNKNYKPIMLIFIDDKENNEQEKIIEKYSQNNVLTLDSTRITELINKMKKCMFIYYKLEVIK